MTLYQLLFSRPSLVVNAASLVAQRLAHILISDIHRGSTGKLLRTGLYDMG